MQIMKSSFLVPFVIFGYSWTVMTKDIYFYTEGDYNYTILTDLIPPTEYCGQMIFDVKAEGNAFIALLSGNDDSGPLYEIAFGMNGDTYSVIRKEKIGIANWNGEVLIDWDIFPRYKFVSLFISWNNGTITIGKVGSFNLTWVDPSPLSIKNIAVSTAGSLVGEWNFTTPVSIPQGCEEVSQPTTTSTQCNCPCTPVGENKWSFIEGLNLTREEIKIMMEEELQQIRQNLTIDKTDTSAYMRTKISAPDDRMSSKSMGILGIILLTSVLMLVVGSDLLNAFRNPLFCHRKQF